MMFLEPIQLPERVKAEESSLDLNYGKFEIGPLEPGYATTVGNTLRRVLLSSIQGAAVKYVKIEGLHHEFTPIPGSDSDFIDLILRLKKLILKAESISDEKLILEHKGKGVITAADIQESMTMAVVNKDLFLLEMTEDIDFRMELWIGIGRGYVPADKHDLDDKPVGVIPIDSIYSPIKKVNFDVANERVGEKIDYDQLIMEVFTDGSVDPKESLYVAAKLLKDLYKSIVGFEKEPEYIQEIEMDPELERLEKIFNTNVNELELSVRCSNCLAAAKIDSIGELIEKTENEMLKYRNFGKKSLEEINALLDKYELSLGYNVEGKMSQIEEAKNKVTFKNNS